MTQKQIAEHFGVPQCDVCLAIQSAGVKPERHGRIREWDLYETGAALVQLYANREAWLLKKAEKWGNKAVAVSEIMNQDNR